MEYAEVVKQLRVANIKYIRFMLIDIHGRPKGQLMPLEKALPVLEHGFGFDGSSIPGFVNIEESDVVAIPDLSTMFFEYWSDTRIATFICDVYIDSNKPLPHYSREVLRSAIKWAEEKGYKFKFGVELEFFIVKLKNGKPEHVDNAVYFDLPPLLNIENILPFLFDSLYQSLRES